MIRSEYELIAEEFSLIRMNATDRLVVQQRRMRELVRPHLDGVMRGVGSGVAEALRESSLVGRYLDEVMHRAMQA